jgi:hypothetical protein
MVKTVTRRKTATSPLATRLVAYLAAKQQIKEATKEAEVAKKALIEHVDHYHETDPEKGHLLHTLPEPLTFMGQTFTGMQKQRKTSQAFLEDVADKLCAEKGLEVDDYTSRYVDQEKISRLYSEDKLTDEEFNSLFETNETWAFVPMKD